VGGRERRRANAKRRGFRRREAFSAVFAWQASGARCFGFSLATRRAAEGSDVTRRVA